jgi:hypothetical protein
VEGAVWKKIGSIGCPCSNLQTLLHPNPRAQKHIQEENYGAESLVACGPIWVTVLPTASPPPTETYSFLLCVCVCVCKRKWDRERGTHRSFLPILLLSTFFVFLFFFHSLRPIISHPVVITTSIPFFPLLHNHTPIGSRGVQSKPTFFIPLLHYKIIIVELHFYSLFPTLLSLFTILSSFQQASLYQLYVFKI